MTETPAYQQALEHIADLEAQNARLRRLLEQADAPAELRHRLRSTLALLRSLIHRSAASRRDIDDYVAHLDDRIEAIIRAQASADMHGGVDLKTLIAEELLFYGVLESEQLELNGPDVVTTPRIGQALALAFHELAVNSVEHGGMGQAEGRIVVSWTITDDILNLDWTETGPTVGNPDGKHGFGTEFITKARPYQLDATTTLSIQTNAVHCNISVPLHRRA